MLNRLVIFMLISSSVLTAYSLENPGGGKTKKGSPEREKAINDLFKTYGEKNVYETAQKLLLEEFGFQKTVHEEFRESLKSFNSKSFEKLERTLILQAKPPSEKGILKKPKTKSFSMRNYPGDHINGNLLLDKEIENQIKEWPSSFQADPDRFSSDTRSSSQLKVRYDGNGEYTYIISSKPEDKGNFYFRKVQKNPFGDGYRELEKHPLSPDDLEKMDGIYKTRIFEKTTEDISIIHAGTIRDNKFTVQTGKTTESFTLPVDQTEWDEAVTDMICLRIVQHCPSKDIIIARDLFVRDITDVDVSSLMIENDFKSFKSQRLNPLHLLEKLQTKFPDKRFYLGSDIDKDISAIRSLPAVNSASDISAFTAPKSLDVTYDLVAKEYVRNSLTQNDIKIIDLDKPEEKSDKLNSKIIFITGNKDEKLAMCLDKINQETNLKDKTLIIFSCGEKGDDYSYSSFIWKSKSNSIISFPTKINPDAVRELIMKFSKLVGDKPNGKSPNELLNKAIKEASIECKDDPFLKEEIEKLRNYIQQTSFEYNQEKDQVITKS